MDPKSAASAILRRLAVALKTHALYPPPSPVTDRAVGELLEGLQDYLHAHGLFSARVSRRSFHVNDATFKDTTSANLAFHLYSRKIIGFQCIPGVDAADLLALVTALRQDRAALQASGGLAAALRNADVRTIRVMEIVLAPGAAETDESDPALWDLIGDGQELSPEHASAVAEILRAGPAAIGGLFEQVRTMLAHAVDGQALDWSQTAFDVIKNLDRVITSQPADERPQFYNHLAAAILLLEDPVRTPLERTLAAREGTDRTARVLLDQMSEQRLGQLVPRGVLEDDGAAPDGDGTDAPAVVDPEMQIARAQAASVANTAGVTNASGVVNAAGGAISGAISDPLTFAYDESVDHLRHEAEAIDEASVNREAVGTLIDLLVSQSDDPDTVEAIAAVEEQVPGLVARHEFRLLRAAVESLVFAAERVRTRDHTVARLADRLVREQALDVLVEMLWINRGAKVEDDVRACLLILADGFAGPLMRRLGEEPRLPVRRMLCDVLVAMGPNRLDDVGRFADDPRWYLARNVAYVLGRLGDARGIPYVGRLVGHADHRVRSEAAAALARIGGPQADAHLAAMLGDADDRVRLKAVLSLGDGGVILALDALIALLEQPDPFGRHFHIKQEVIATLARAGAEGALPALARIAGRRFAFGWRARALRTMARDAIDEIKGRGVPSRHSALTVSTPTGAW
jgi:hypothetical protein